MAEGRAIGGSRKVTVPAGGPAILSRARLEERLDDAPRRRLTLVTAGHGLGKTTLLAAWARRRDAAWYAAGSEDRDPAVLARGLLEAVRVQVPAVDPDSVTPSPTGEALTIASDGRAALAADEVIAMLGERLDADLSRGGDLRGLVRHVATGTETLFLGDEEILGVLHQASGPRTAIDG